MEVSRLGVESELQQMANATATVTRDPSHFCNPHHSSQQCQILNPLRKARDRTSSRMLVGFLIYRATTGTPHISFNPFFFSLSSNGTTRELIKNAESQIC